MLKYYIKGYERMIAHVYPGKKMSVLIYKKSIKYILACSKARGEKVL